MVESTTGLFCNDFMVDSTISFWDGHTCRAPAIQAGDNNVSGLYSSPIAQSCYGRVYHTGKID